MNRYRIASVVAAAATIAALFYVAYAGRVHDWLVGPPVPATLIQQEDR